jgi:hypothetical protein
MVPMPQGDTGLVFVGEEVQKRAGLRRPGKQFNDGQQQLSAERELGFAVAVGEESEVVERVFRG